ncbi:hypothetical protein [uncultured Thiodictyon sp.]|uniref:hypothetical protein n=1 Tax=uncultured Thiodictyon sp. TaxID=1846217 RepID=UPI0025E505CB|nr:hypothetical protein [uncultured Thiodictyon sp.]
MEKRGGLDDFSLLGGPLNRLGCRLGLVRGGTDTVPLGLVLGAVPWIVLVALALVEGLGDALFSIAAIGKHVRLLVAVPLLFVCEAFIDPRFTAFVQGIVRSQIVPASEQAALNTELARIARWKDAWLPEAFFLLAVAWLALTMQSGDIFEYLFGLAGTSSPRGLGETTWTSHWNWIVCKPLFQFLLLRWLWRLTLWSILLWRISRLELRLVPAHPDHAGGLGYLELVHTEFIPLVLAISAVQSASLAQAIALGGMTIDAIYPSVAFVLLVDVVLFLGPLLIFSRELWKSKVTGMSNYGALAERYVSEFDRKWLGADPAPAEPLLGTADIQSLADLSNAVGIVRDMRLVPVSQSMLIYLAVAALLPLLPLVLFKYPFTDLLAKFFGGLSGL